MARPNGQPELTPQQPSLAQGQPAQQAPGYAHPQQMTAQQYAQYQQAYAQQQAAYQAQQQQAQAYAAAQQRAAAPQPQPAQQPAQPHPGYPQQQAYYAAPQGQPVQQAPQQPTYAPQPQPQVQPQAYQPQQQYAAAPQVRQAAAPQPTYAPAAPSASVLAAQPQVAPQRGDLHLGHYATPPQQPRPAQPQGYAQQPGYAQPAMTPQSPPYAQPQTARPLQSTTTMAPAQQAEQLPDDLEYEEEEETPSRGKKSLAVVALLIGALGLGAGLAYVWRINGGFKSASGGPPVVRADTAAVKTKPADPGRKELPNQNLEVAQRPAAAPLPPVEPAKPATEPTTTVADGGPRPVRIIPITPAPVGGPPPGAAPSGPPAPQSPLAGLVVQNSGPPLPPRVAVAPPAAPPVAQPPVQAAPPAPPAPPKRAALAPTIQPTEPAPAPAAKAPPAPKPAAEKTPVAKAPPKAAANDAFSPTGVTQAPPAGVGAPKAPSLGFVAAVSSQPTREGAMKAFADVQQKYGSVLGGQPADIREATVNGKTVYRAVVGVPGSREAASQTCAKLKEAGFAGCWPTAY